MLPALLFAQQRGSEYPPNAEPGKCYSRLYIPSEYDYVEVTEIDKPAKTKSIKVPAIYEYVYDTVILSPARKEIKVIPASYETVVEKVMVAPPTTRWQKGKVDPNCISDNPQDCQVLCLVEVPAQYTSYSRRVLKAPAHTREINIPADIKITTKRILKNPATTKEITIPATYKTVMKRVVSKEGGYADWKEVICQHQITIDLIREVQGALKTKGYDPGPVDGAWGNKTAEALTKYQSDNNLPIGRHLNVEAIKSLGIDYVEYEK